MEKYLPDRRTGKHAIDYVPKRIWRGFLVVTTFELVNQKLRYHSSFIVTFYFCFYLSNYCFQILIKVSIQGSKNTPHIFYLHTPKEIKTKSLKFYNKFKPTYLYTFTTLMLNITYTFIHHFSDMLPLNVSYTHNITSFKTYSHNHTSIFYTSRPSSPTFFNTILMLITILNIYFFYING